jgi:hypothetical protein
MRIEITKGRTEDRVAVVRTDETRADFGFPKKGPFPHDAVHFFVERGLGMDRGFWGLVAGGLDPATVQSLASAGGHASAKRARTPDPAIVQLLQAERLVECFEASAWGGGADDAAIMAMAEPAWAASHVPPPDGAPERFGAIRTTLDAFIEDWNAAQDGTTFALDWPASENDGVTQ